MRDYVIVTDSCCDLPEHIVKELDVPVLALAVIFGSEHFYNRPGEGPSSHEFYERLYKGESAQTSAVNMEEFKEFFRPFLQEGKDLLYVAFSSALSATYHNSCLAIEELREEFPEAEIEAVDTLCASLGQGMMVDLAVQEKRKGKSLDEVRIFLEEQKHRMHHWFTVGNLVQLRRGGRLSAGKAVFGSLLQVKPILKVDAVGHLVPVDTVKGRKKVIPHLMEKIEENIEHPEDQRVYVVHSDCLEDAKALAAAMQERFPVKEVVIGEIGPVIGSHSGRDTLAAFFLGKVREL